MTEKSEPKRVYSTYDDYPSCGIVVLPDLNVLKAVLKEGRRSEETSEIREKPRIEYNDDGKGYFYFRYIDKEGNVADEPQMGLSFYSSYIYCGQKRMENKGQISLVRVEGLAKKLKLEEELRQITKVNHTWNA